MIDDRSAGGSHVVSFRYTAWYCAGGHVGITETTAATTEAAIGSSAWQRVHGQRARQPPERCPCWLPGLNRDHEACSSLCCLRSSSVSVRQARYWSRRERRVVETPKGSFVGLSISVEAGDGKVLKMK